MDRQSYNKIKRVMKRILNYLNDLQLDQKAEMILNGNLTRNVVQQKSEEFQTLAEHDKVLYMSKLNGRIRQITKPYKALSVLVFVDELMKRGQLACLPHMEFKQLKDAVQVEQVILANIFKYYHYFLEMNNCSYYNKFTVNKENQLNEAEYYCQISILKIMQFLKIQFVFTHGWAKLNKHRLLLREVIQSILLRFVEDLKIMTLFVTNNEDTMRQKTISHPLVFQIYHVYEKLIFINKNTSKLQTLGRMAHCELQFPLYEFNVELNKEIQLVMLKRREENKLSAGSIFIKLEEPQCFDEQAIKTTESFLLLNDFGQCS